MDRQLAHTRQCCKLYRDNRAEFERQVRAQVRGLLGIEDEEAGASASASAPSA